MTSAPHVLITGGAGFVGTNLAARLAGQGRPVLVYDNLARPGVERNLRWLRDTFPGLVQFKCADVRDAKQMEDAVAGASAVFHLAAQVAVTTSLTDPRLDFEVNAYGTLNVLEAIRAREVRPPLVFTSTNKVLGGLDRLTLRERGARYEPSDESVRESGIGEEFGLSFCSPYGCSKGAADQYVLDYARTFGLSATVFRMSCIYGPHQCGNEDQGWVAHFLRQAILGEPITIFGDGKQVRDALFVEDLVDALLLAQDHIESLSGEAFNIGGGVQNTTSLLELIEAIAHLRGERPFVTFEPWRPSDQRYYVSDVRAYTEHTGWAPRVTFAQGVERLHGWLREDLASSVRTAEAVRA